MIKKLIFSIFVAVATFSAVIYVQSRSNIQNDVLKANVEALAGGEELEGVTIVCDQTWEGKTEAMCWEQEVTYPWAEKKCRWTGLRTVCNTFIGWS